MKEYKIYKITNLVNGKAYIGQTYWSLDARFNKHCTSPYPIGKAIRKHGRENFTIELIEKTTSQDANRREITMIAAFDTQRPNGYNATAGGQFSAPMSDEARQKQSERMKQHIKDGTGCRSPEATAKRKIADKNRPPRSEEFRRKSAASAQRLTEDQRGFRSPEARAKQSIAAKNRGNIRRTIIATNLITKEEHHFPDLFTARDWLDVTYTTTLTMVLNSRTKKNFKGYRWTYQ